jgi:hypothetical protein
MEQPSSAGCSRSLAETSSRSPAAGSSYNEVANTEFHLDIDVSELLVIREQIFPSLDYKTLHRIALAPASPTH